MFSPRYTSLINYVSSRSIGEIADSFKTRISNWGNPYQTKIDRRRQVKDPNIVSDKAECLKWVNWRMRKDVITRDTVSRYWQYRMNLHSLAKCDTLPSTIQDIAIADRADTPRKSSIVKTVNRCALSSRPRGKIIRFRLSRILYREQADHGLLSGPIRAKWG